jgi:P-type Ca2+ transporter type 2C
MLFLAASIFNINEGIALTPLMVLFLLFFISIFPVVTIMHEQPGPGMMARPPRDPKVKLSNPVAIRQWAFYGGMLFLVTFMQQLLLTTSLTGGQWAACIGLALLVPITIELSKIPRRRHLLAPAPVAIDPVEAVAPQRGR